MPPKKAAIKVYAPATVANLACGFDVMGLSVREPGDELSLMLNSSGKISVRRIIGDGGKLSSDPKKNTASVAIQAMLDHMGIRQGADIVLRKRMPLGSGLGSSAASAVAGVFAMNELLGRPFSKSALVPFAMEGERIACGSAHADNVAPSMMGGIVLIRSYHPLEIISLPVPSQMYIALVHPQVEVLTRDARAVLPRKIPLETGIRQWANTASLVAGLFSSNFTLIGKSMEDHVAEPARAKLIPYFKEAKEAALLDGALSFSISGSGPTVFAVCKGKASALRVMSSIKKMYRDKKIPTDQYLSPVNRDGVIVIP